VVVGEWTGGSPAASSSFGVDDVTVTRP
jgi:hypothetical protein